VLSWDLSTVEMDVLVETLRLPSLPYPLEVPSPGVTFDDRRRHVEAVLADLAGRGLVRTDLTGDLGVAIELLASGELVIDGRLAVGRPLDLVGALRGDQAALAVQTGDTVRVSLVHERDLVRLIVDMLPPLRRLTGNSKSIPHEALTNALTAFAESGDYFEFERILTQAGVRDQDVRLLAGLVRAGSAAAQFGVALRTPTTDAYRERRVWAWYATEAGGVLLSNDSTGSPAWTTLVPADPARVGQYLRDALYALKYGRDQSQTGGARVV
jgi:ESX secretion-associated protein EspG